MPLCRHGHPVGSAAAAEELGAFVSGRGPSGSVPSGAHPLSGFVGTAVAVKDNIDVAGWPTRAGAEAMSDIPATRDAEVVRRLREAGAIIPAKTRMDEFAMTTYGPGMRNPFDHHRSVGGSSGGSAVAVAVGGFCAALGTDTGGSVRIPASYCGVVGFKPTFGRIPVDGVVPLGISYDHVGVIGCSVASVREVFAPVADEATAEDRMPAGAGRGLASLRVGVPAGAFLDAATPEVREAYDDMVFALELRGASVVEIDLPRIDTVLPVNYAIVRAEALEYHSTHFTDFSRHGDEMREILRAAANYSDADLGEAREQRARHTLAVDAVFDTVDVIVTPTTPTTAPVRGREFIELGDRSVDFVTATIWFTGLFNGTGMPAISLPLRHSGKLPIGFQLVAPRDQDFSLLEIAELVERLPPNPQHH